ncbi:hypothetical protein BD410DRAFT_792717 [Rickenella mellea]|uniref:Mug135-like C-terminal domain-containing protein n=1 Tax=Rickenella mellea TaxID=50990 RepID=A0A4Y7PV68_9AGAM|nr:hypothetical protein BD410DRAFT_792717 [Rickenella mellea]
MSHEQPQDLPQIIIPDVILADVVNKPPQQPQNPPTDMDVTIAVNYHAATYDSYGRGEVSDELYSAACNYRVAVTAQKDSKPFAPAPPWVYPVMYKVLKPITDDISDIKDMLTRTTRTSAKLHNLEVGRGNRTTFQVVPFANGADPTQLPHRLPPLFDFNTVQGLSDVERTAYYQGYFPGTNLPDPEEQTNRILLAIGWRTE